MVTQERIVRGGGGEMRGVRASHFCIAYCDPCFIQTEIP
jgi:hypothetical protein